MPEAHHHGNASVVKEQRCDKAQPGVNGKVFLKNTDPKPVNNNCGKELMEPAVTGAEDGETDEGLQNAELETLKQAAAGAKSSGSVSRTVDQLKHSNAGGGAGHFRHSQRRFPPEARARPRPNSWPRRCNVRRSPSNLKRAPAVFASLRSRGPAAASEKVPVTCEDLHQPPAPQVSPPAQWRPPSPQDWDPVLPQQDAMLHQR